MLIDRQLDSACRQSLDRLHSNDNGLREGVSKLGKSEIGKLERPAIPQERRFFARAIQF